MYKMTLKQSTMLVKYRRILCIAFMAYIAMLEAVLTLATSSSSSSSSSSVATTRTNNGHGIPKDLDSNSSSSIHSRRIISASSEPLQSSRSCVQHCSESQMLSHPSRRTFPTTNNSLTSPIKGLAFVSPHHHPFVPSVSIINDMKTSCQHKSMTAPASKSTRLCMSSSPARQSSYSKSSRSTGSGSRKQQNSRNRGANAANHNRRGHEFRRSAGDGQGGRVRPKKTAKRAPRWEREGDRLYAEVTKQLDAYNGNGDGNVRDGEEGGGDSERLMALANERIETVGDVYRLLAPWMATEEEQLEAAARKEKEDEIDTPTATSNNSNREETTEKEKETDSSPNKCNKPPPFLWGTLPVGPVLSTRLYASQRSSPTSVQRAAFPILTAGPSSKNKRNAPKGVPVKRTNAIIASPTGTGKTLAYLLPLLCTSPGGQGGEGTGGVLIVTPTIELAVQIQREVDVLWPRESNGSGTQSSCFVVGADGDDDGREYDDDNESFSPGRITLQSIARAPLIAGTPKMLRMLYREAERIARDPDYSTYTPRERDTSKALLQNLRAIVLDEADRLLRTEAASREAAERKARKIAQRKAEEAGAPPLKKKRLTIARPTQTELLLRDLPLPNLDDVQVVCASATIGRTMRRQLMQILDVPSADAAATLVTGDEDVRAKSKDVVRRRGALLPERLRHAYRVVEEEEEEEGSVVVEDGMSTAERNEEKRVKSTLSALWDTMVSMEEAKPIIVFPGRVGVDRVRADLMARGLDDVRTLRNLDGTTPEPTEDDHLGNETPPIDYSHREWKSTPVYVIGERFARGLDLPDISRVFILSPPSSAAGYAHMAGRTGRVGREGTAITLVRPERNGNEVRRLAAIAEALGLKFDASVSGSGDVLGANDGGGEVGNGDGAEVSGDDNSSKTLLRSGQDDGILSESSVVASESSPPTISYPWELLSEAALKRKKNAELYQYLVSFGDETIHIDERSKKAEMVSAIQSLHSKR